MQYFLFGGLLEFSRNDRFVEEVVRLVEIENNVQFAHVTEVTVQDLDVVVDHLERQHSNTAEQQNEHQQSTPAVRTCTALQIQPRISTDDRRER
jgi:hypothetical protein